MAFPDGASWARLELIGDDYLPVLAIQAVDGQRAVEGIRRVRALHAAAARYRDARSIVTVRPGQTRTRCASATSCSATGW